MALDVDIRGQSGIQADVDASGRMLVRLPDATTPANVGGVRLFSENDPGTQTGAAYLYSPETDEDYRLRVAQDTLLDEEVFNYAAQNTGKYNFGNTTLAAVWTTGGLLLNSGSITTTSTSARLRTYATFPLMDPGTLNISATVAFSAQPVANTLIDFGLFLDGASNPFAPTDGVFFRLTSGGLYGVINHNGSELTTSAFTFTYTAGRFYQFMIVVHEREVHFWIDNVLYATLETPVAQGQPYASESLPFAIRHAIVGGAAGGVLQTTLKNYSVSIGGLQICDTLSEINNRMLGSYQGLSGGTMGTLASYANSADPTASAALNNTTALVTGLGGQFRFNAAVTAVTDGIVCSFQVPATTVSTRNRRLKVNGIRIDCVNTGAAVATTATVLQWSLAFGHTAVSLATTEAATTKAPRRIPVGLMAWPIGAAIAAPPTGGAIAINFDSPIYVNPGEFFAFVAKFIIGTATGSQVIWGTATVIHSWE
jgi:hypothetical protein